MEEDFARPATPPEHASAWWRRSWPILAPTPLGPGWGWGSRMSEIATLPLSALFYAVLACHAATSWLLGKVLSR